MKRLFILLSVVLASVSAFAQRSAHTYAQPVNSVGDGSFSFGGFGNARTSGIGDTLRMTNIATGDTLVVYSAGADSGYLTGTDYWDDSAFAERYDFNGGDSSVTVIGLFAQFAGKVNAGSTKTISLNLWNVGAQQYITATNFYSGYPDSAFFSDTVLFTQLGIGATTDTLKPFLFNTAIGPLSQSFFAGYSMSYNFATLAGDTIGLASSKNGDRTSAITYEQQIISDIDTVTDTIINVQNATLYTDGNWRDNYTQNDSLKNDLAIFPIVVIAGPTGVKGVTRNNFTFFGNYPNPATDVTNIKFSLAKPEDMTIQIMDMNGRVLSTISQASLLTGEHVVPVNTSPMASGNYLYLIRTSGGEGMASELVVKH